jgi:hypothetical protein
VRTWLQATCGNAFGQREVLMTLRLWAACLSWSFPGGPSGKTLIYVLTSAEA